MTTRKTTNGERLLKDVIMLGFIPWLPIYKAYHWAKQEAK